jgi:hypothetical protein
MYYVYILYIHILHICTYKFTYMHVQMRFTNIICIYVRRFGESDADLSLEDKMFLRFQKERVKKAKNVSIFNLDGGEDTLTHKGMYLCIDVF